MKKVALILLSCITLFNLCACSTASTEATTDTQAERYGGHLNVCISGISYLDPLKQATNENYQWTTMIFENALTRDIDNNIQPGVCDYTLSEDETVLTMWVRENVKFHNGDTVDIYDVEASIQRAFNRYSSFIDKVVPYVAGMNVEDDKLTITLTEPREDALYYLAAYRTWCPVMPKEICEKYSGSDNKETIEDCIGTGPYKVTDFKRNSYVTMSRFEEYTVNENGLSGFAGPKYAYLDSVTFFNEPDETEAVNGLFDGTYDCIGTMPPALVGGLEAKNLSMTSGLSTNMGCYLYFNTTGTDSVCKKYPSLRKAIMAAIDTEELLSELTNGNYINAATPIMGDAYKSDVFENADYLGPANPELAQHYMDQAKLEGWNGTDRVVIIPFDGIYADTLLADYLESAQIPVKYEEATNRNNSTSWRLKSTSHWDVYFYTVGFAITPTLLQDAIVNRYWKNIDKNVLIAQMKTMQVGSPEYMKKWDELAQLWVDDCALGFLGFKSGTLYHVKGLNNNEDDGAMVRYWFNAYWDDPENHTA